MDGPEIRKLYYSTKEVSDITKISPQLLRLWEDRIPNLKPSKSKSGRRLYKPDDVKIILLIKEWKEEGYSDEEINSLIHRTDIHDHEVGKSEPAGKKSQHAEQFFEILNGLREILNILDESAPAPDHSD